MAHGFFTDTTVCIGCKACEVACKQWNQLPDDGMVWSGLSYDNTLHLGSTTWRHVAFIEREKPLESQTTGLGAFSRNSAMSPKMMESVGHAFAQAGSMSAFSRS